MAFEQSFINYGVIKIESGNVRLYCDQYNNITISLGNAVSAHWAGGCVVVNLADGSVRRYTDQYNYSTI